MGYYQGNGARLIAGILPSAKLPQTQPACLTDASVGLVDCGNWAVSASWTIPTTAVSGIYFADLVRNDTGGANQIIFVVRNELSHSDVVFQTADETWHAYNGFGGHSFYGPASGFDLTNRGYKVSYNRPFEYIENESQPFYAEYPMVRWLEANSYDVSYISSVDSARNGTLIKNHKLFLSVGHDEYWSGPKRASVEAARDAGVNLAFFSGNEAFWKTRWESSIDGSATPFRTLVCYKETLGPSSNPIGTGVVDPLDPPTWTGTWRDPSKSPPGDGGRPENALTGQLFRVNGPGSDNTNLSIKIPAVQGKLRFWRNTQVAAQSAGQVWVLPPASLGYEWDAEEDNGSRPAGLFDVSTATYTLTTDYLQDYGGLYGAGTATHHMSIYRAPSGALVFGAGTVQWSWGLDSNHDGSGFVVDLEMQQATVNLFADMGVQPATPQSGLVLAAKSTDTTPPASVITTPPSGLVVQAGTTVTVSGTATDAGGGLVAAVEVSVDSGATWHPATGTTSWTYTWNTPIGGNFTLLSRAVDDSANLETPATGVSVTVVGISSLSLNQPSVSGGSSLTGTVTLSTPAGNGGVTIALSSGSPSIVSVPSSILIPAGSTSANFTATTVAVSTNTVVTVSATYGTVVKASVTVTPAFPPPPGTLAVDVSISSEQQASASTMSSPTFSTAVGNELVLALISSDAIQPNMIVTSVSGGGLTWSLVVRTNAQGGTSEIWKAFAPVKLSNIAVTASFSQTSPAADMTIVSFAGADPSGSNGSAAIGNTASSNSAKGAPTASLTTTRNNSWVVGVGNDYTNALARSLGSGQTILSQFLTPTGDTLWSQMQNAPTPSAGSTVAINDIAPAADSYNLSIAEIRPPVVGPYNISGSLSTIGAGATVTLSGALTGTITADASGNYSFTGLVAGSYTITPAKSGFVFTPLSQSVSITNASVANVNFTASQSFTISGSITPSANGSGATVALTGTTSGSTTTDSSGNYTFTGVVDGTYTVTPSKAGVSFSPTSQTITVNGSSITGLNFTASQQGFSLSGNVSVSGAGATISLSGPTSATAVADASGNYTFSGLGSGTYIVSPTKAGFTFTPTSLNVSVSGANVGNVNFTAQGNATSGLALDSSVSEDGTTASSSITSPSFSTKTGNELLLAFISTDYLGGANTTVTSVSGGGLAWTLAVRANGESGTSEIWRAFATSALTNVSVTANLSQSVVSSITIETITGADATGVNGSGAVGATASKSAASGAPSASLVTTRSGSWTFGVGNDFANAIARTPSSGQSLIHQDLTTAGDTYWVQMQNSTTPLSGTTVSISDTAPTGDMYNLAAVEVLPVLGPYSISGTVTPAQAGITLSLTGTVNASTSVDGSGNYNFSGLPNGSYTITAAKSGATFSPASQNVTIGGNSISGVNFSALQPVLTLSGTSALFVMNSGGSSPSSTAIGVTNTGGSTLSFTTASDSAWLTVTPTSGTAPATLQISASTNGLALGTYVGHVTVTATGSAGSPATIAVTLKVVMPTDWLTVEHDEARSGLAVDETTLTTANVGNLSLSWETRVDGSVTAQPLYIHSMNVGGQVRDVVIVGTGLNSLYMLDASSGAQIWKRNFGAPTPNTWGLPDGFGIEAPPYIDRVAGRLYTVSTDGNFHVLSLADGTDLFAPLSVIANPATNKVWGGLNKFGNNVYFATGSNGGDVAPWRGQVYQIDVTSTPALTGDFVVVPSIPAPNGGGGIWGYGGVSIDLANGNVYAASADDSNVSTGGTEGYTPYSDSMIALNSNLGLLGYYQAQQPTTYSCEGAPCDLDFASTPLIFQPAGCPQLLATGNKNGNLYLFKASDLAASGQPLQILTLNAAADSLGSGGIGGTPVYYPATNMLYVADAGPGVTGVAAGLVAMKVTNACTLQVAWSNALGGNDSPNSTPTIANGMVFVGQGNTGVIHAYDATSGAELWHSGSNYGAAATFAAPIVAGGKVYAGSWTSFNGGGIVGAFSLPATTFSVSGTVSPAASGTGTLLTLSGAGSATVTADSSGNYTFSGLANGTYTVTPSKAGFTFNPTSQTVTVNGTNITGVSFTATGQTWSISGNVSTNGSGATVGLSGSATASTTADSSGNYTFSGLSNGTYTITPSKSGFTFNPASQNVTVNGGNVSAVNFTASAVTAALAMDVNVSKDGTTASTTIATPAFTTKSGNELLLAFIATDYLGGTNTTVSSVSGGGLTWNLVKRTNAQSGDAEIWAALAPSALSSVTVTATVSQSVVCSITVLSFTGVDTTLGTSLPNAVGATGTGNAKTGAPTASLVTTRSNSWVFGVGNDYDNAIARTPGTGQSIVHQFLTPTGDTYWVQMQNSTTAAIGTTVPINDTAPTGDRYNLTTVEVRTP